MTSRGTAIMVAVAVVAGVTVAAVLLATQGSGKPTRVLQIDEVNGRVGRAVLGETRENISGVLGKPLSSGMGHGGDDILYPHLALKLDAKGRLVSISTDDPAARTERAVRIGDPISAARASYGKAARCVPNSPDKTAKHPHCTVKVPAGVLEITGDPIRAMTLAGTRSA